MTSFKRTQRKYVQKAYRVVCRKSAEDNPHAESQLQPACSGI